MSASFYRIYALFAKLHKKAALFGKVVDNWGKFSYNKSRANTLVIHIFPQRGSYFG